MYNFLTHADVDINHCCESTKASSYLQLDSISLSTITHLFCHERISVFTPDSARSSPNLQILLKCVSRHQIEKSLSNEIFFFFLFIPLKKKRPHYSLHRVRGDTDTNGSDKRIKHKMCSDDTLEVRCAPGLPPAGELHARMRGGARGGAEETSPENKRRCLPVRRRFRWVESRWRLVWHQSCNTVHKGTFQVAFVSNHLSSPPPPLPSPFTNQTSNYWTISQTELGDTTCTHCSSVYPSYRFCFGRLHNFQQLFQPFW